MGVLLVASHLSARAPGSGCDDKGVSLALPDMPEDVLMDVESDVYVVVLCCTTSGGCL